MVPSSETTVDDSAWKALEAAVTAFNKKHSVLMKLAASERAMTHKFAECLACELHKQDLAGWDVDCEYNRQGAGGDPKQVDGLRADFERLVAAGMTAEDASAAAVALGDSGTSIYPDIIVHIRKEQKNLMVIEAKKVSGTTPMSRWEKRAHDWDEHKLRRLRSEMGYRILVRLIFDLQTHRCSVERVGDEHSV